MFLYYWFIFHSYSDPAKNTPFNMNAQMTVQLYTAYTRRTNCPTGKNGGEGGEREGQGEEERDGGGIGEGKGRKRLFDVVRIIRGHHIFGYHIQCNLTRI